MLPKDQLTGECTGRTKKHNHNTVEKEDLAGHSHKFLCLVPCVTADDKQPSLFSPVFAQLACVASQLSGSRDSPTISVFV